MTTQLETAPADASIARATEAWQRLYDGELVISPASESTPAARTVAVSHPDFRADPGNWPKILHHPRPTERVVVLIHGLQDSPGYLEAIAGAFFKRGVNVVLPLLAAHGRRDPVREMARVDCQAWRTMVDQAVEIAGMLGREISIGGLSTGGALSVDKCLRDPDTITGKVFLFAAALALTPIQRLVLSTAAVPRWADARSARRPNNGIGGNPVKYSRRFLEGARQLHLIIGSIRRQLSLPWFRPFARLPLPADLSDRVFVAHSEADRTIHLSAVASLIQPDDPGQHHIVPATTGVAHADLVLSEALSFTEKWPDEPAPPRANPEYDAMMSKALAFLERELRRFGNYTTC